MKPILYCALSFMFLAAACNNNNSTDKQDKKQTAKQKNFDPSGLDSIGIENLNVATDMKDIICQDWENKEDAADAKGMDPASNIEIVYRGYCLFSDGTLVKDPRGNIQAGKWTLDENVKPISLHFDLNSGEKENWQLAYLMPYEMKLVKLVNGNRSTVDLGSEAVRHNKLYEDPFYISNNKWRFKPSKPETDEQIKDRLKQCIHFFILFYDEKINVHSDAVSFTGLPSCFKWYGGGIFLQKENELPEKWVNSFYNREQAMKAYKLADKLLGIKYNWPKKESNWLKLNVAVLRQMEKKIDSL